MLRAAILLGFAAILPASAEPNRAYLVVHTVAYGGVTQSQTVFRYGSMIECAAALQKMELRFSPTGNARLARPMICIGHRPAWWLEAETN